MECEYHSALREEWEQEQLIGFMQDMVGTIYRLNDDIDSANAKLEYALSSYLKSVGKEDAGAPFWQSVMR